MLRTILLQPLFNVLLVFYGLIPGHDLGVAVILLTIVIRLLLWPLVRRQLHHQKTMRDLQPEIAKIKAKAAGDKQKESAMMLELFKEKEINPFGSLGLAFLQFPILIALFFVLRRILDPSQISGLAYGFVLKLQTVKDILANQGHFDPTFIGLVHMAKPSLVLALMAGLAQYVQARQITPRNTTKTDPMSNLGFSMNLIFPILTVTIATRLPAALALYWFASSVVAVIQQQMVLKSDLSWLLKFDPRKLAKNGKSTS